MGRYHAVAVTEDHRWKHFEICVKRYWWSPWRQILTVDPGVEEYKIEDDEERRQALFNKAKRIADALKANPILYRA